MSTTLARRLGFAALIIYGIGDILGAGIYALVGKVIGLAGPGAWLTFVMSAVVAIITGLSYAELTARYPVSAGAAAFVRRAFPGRFIATVTGVIVLGTGLASAATVTVAFSHYLQGIMPIPAPLAQVILIGGISFLSFWGIHESSQVNIFLTFVEVSGLLAVILVGASLITGTSWDQFLQTSQTGIHFPAVLSGVTIAFYAYIGFEDLANLAEECINPKRDLPRAILIAISVTTVVYLLVTLVLQITIPETIIAASDTPLLLVFEKAGMGWMLKYFSIVAILAITNTGLINLIMASRLMYGMAHEGLLPKPIGKVHHRRRTPWVGVLIALIGVLLLVFTGGLKVLAQTTSLLIIVVFLMVHLSLIQIKSRLNIPHDGIQFPILFPILGALSCLVILSQFPAAAYLRSLLVVGIGVFLWGVQFKRKEK